MDKVNPLPPFLVDRYHAWQARLQSVKERLAQLAELGQAPQGMIIACCDSRVMATEIFGGEAGDFFVHRNIANLVPECRQDSAARGTSATVEYAINVLKVQHLIVMGHSGCGGVAGCHDMLSGAPGAPSADSFVGKWLTTLRPGYERVEALNLDRPEALRALEHQAVLVSLENLMDFPFVAEAVADERLQLHGIWNDISNGSLAYFDSGSGKFVAV